MHAGTVLVAKGKEQEREALMSPRVPLPPHEPEYLHKPCCHQPGRKKARKAMEAEEITGRMESLGVWFSLDLTCAFPRLLTLPLLQLE